MKKIIKKLIEEFKIKTALKVFNGTPTAYVEYEKKLRKKNNQQ